MSELVLFAVCVFFIIAFAVEKKQNKLLKNQIDKICREQETLRQAIIKLFQRKSYEKDFIAKSYNQQKLEKLCKKTRLI